MRDLPGLYVDLGYGADAITTVETFRRLRRLDRRAQVLGVEIDPARVAGAQRHAVPGLAFRLGGFDLPLRPGERAAVVRAFNVLRQYGESAVEGALSALAPALAPGGVLLEGTSDPTGRLVAFTVHRKAASGAALEPLGLVLAPTLSAAFRPRQLQPVLPKRHVHRAEPRGDVDRFFGAWEVAWQSCRREADDPRRVFAESARRLGERDGYAVDRRAGLLRRAFLWLGPAWPARRALDPVHEGPSARAGLTSPSGV